MEEGNKDAPNAHMKKETKSSQKLQKLTKKEIKDAPKTLCVNLFLVYQSWVRRVYAKGAKKKTSNFMGEDGWINFSHCANFT